MGDLSVLTGVLSTISLSFGHSKEKEIRCISVTYILIGGWCVCVCFIYVSIYKVVWPFLGRVSIGGDFQY